MIIALRDKKGCNASVQWSDLTDHSAAADHVLFEEPKMDFSKNDVRISK